MQIQNYSFGRMQIDGENYTRDIIILPNGVIKDWWRENSHLVQECDLVLLEDQNFNELIFGTGFYGLMKIDPKLKDHLKSNNINVTIAKTKNAVELFNRSGSNSKAAAFHLTC